MQNIELIKKTYSEIYEKLKELRNLTNTFDMGSIPFEDFIDIEEEACSLRFQINATVFSLAARLEVNKQTKDYIADGKIRFE